MSPGQTQGGYNCLSNSHRRREVTEARQARREGHWVLPTGSWPSSLLQTGSPTLCSPGVQMWAATQGRTIFRRRETSGGPS